MKQIPKPYIQCAVVAGCILAGAWSAGAQTLLFSDNYNVANGNLDTASLSGRTNGVSAGNILPQSTTVEQTISGNQLLLTTPGFDGTGDSGAMRFDKITSKTNLFDWSSGTGGAAVTNAGGLSITYNWTAPNTTSSDWTFLAVGADPADIFGLGYKLLATSTNTSSGILLANNGSAQAYNLGVLSASGTFPATNVSHTVKFDYQFNSWAAGTPVVVSVIVDGHYVLTDEFTWRYGAGSNYMDLGTYQENNTVDNFKVTTFTNTISSGFTPANFNNTGVLPWGSHTDNGSEYYTITNSLGKPCVTFSNGMLTLTSYYYPQNGYNYQSGVVYANVDVPTSGYNYVTLDADIYTPYAGTTGCWPAFWLDSAWTWPPEIDIAEFKGNAGGGNVWQNQDNTSGTWVCVISTMAPGVWHHYGLALGPVTYGNRTYQLYLDGVIKGQGVFLDTQGVPFSIIFNYAMEGSSGTPGPTYNTYIQAKNWKMATH
jgi:hypothetical protein